MPSDSSKPLPWTPEYTISPEQLGFVLQQNTDLDTHTIEFLGEGWDFFNFLVGNEWVIRIPKRHAEADTLNRERGLLEQLQIETRHPTFELWLPNPIGFHLPIAGYRFLPGTPLAEIDPDDVDQSKLASDLGKNLALLHQRSITKPKPFRNPLTNFLEHTEELYETCRNYLSDQHLAHCQRLVDDFDHSNLAPSMVTCHCDLQDEHILLDENHELSAIIDWADMGTAPRFVDFVGLWLWGGNQFFDLTVLNYGIEPNHNERHMVQALGLIYALTAIDFGHLESDQEAIDSGVHSFLQRISVDVDQP